MKRSLLAHSSALLGEVASQLGPNEILMESPAPAVPPRGSRQLDPAARASLITYLQGETRQDEERLHAAAVAGMAVVMPDSYRAE